MSQKKKNNNGGGGGGRESKDQQDLGTSEDAAVAEVIIIGAAEKEVLQQQVDSPSSPFSSSSSSTSDAAVEEDITVVEDAAVPGVKKVVPKVVVIVPHRNREASLKIFKEHMLEDVFRPEVESGDYRFVFVEQGDQRFFNRGAIKNIGFLFVRSEYPDDYQHITLTFNDIDTMPAERGLMDYETTSGVVKHFYGVKWTLGGIVSVRGADFESINGFPNYWHWGYEDNMLKRRVANSGTMTIDYSQFFEMNNAKVIHHSNFKLKVVNIDEHKRFLANDPEGLAQISNLAYHRTDLSTNELLVSHFDTPFSEGVDKISVFDMTEARTPFSSQPNGTVVPTTPNRSRGGMLSGISGGGRGGRRKAAMKMQFH